MNLKGIDCGGIIGVDELKEVYDFRVKIVLITNPHNPTGRMYEGGELKEIVEWCRRMKVHLIVDEIYCMSVFKGERFYYVLKRFKRRYGTPFYNWSVFKRYQRYSFHNTLTRFIRCFFLFEF